MMLAFLTGLMLGACFSFFFSALLMSGKLADACKFEQFPGQEHGTRQGQRVTANFEGAISMPGGLQRTIKMVVKDLSIMGLGFNILDNFRPVEGDALVIEFELGGGTAVKADGIVRHIRDTHVGLKLIEPSRIKGRSTQLLRIKK